VATYGPPSVPGFPAGFGPQATDFGTWVFRNFAFFQNGVVLRASQATTATTLPDTAVSTKIAYDSILEDPYSGWNASTHLWTPPAGYSGWYQVTVTIRTATLADLVNLQPALAGTWTYGLGILQAQGAGTPGGGASGTFTVYLTGGQDTVGGACGLYNSGSNVSTSLTAGQQSALEIVWVSQS
jgi:hypothetical protein